MFLFLLCILQKIPMANVKVLKNTKHPFDNFDPFEFECNLCGKTKVYTDEEIDKTKKPYKDPQNHDFDFYITCPFCAKSMCQNNIH